MCRPGARVTLRHSTKRTPEHFPAAAEDEPAVLLLGWPVVLLLGWPVVLLLGWPVVLLLGWPVVLLSG